MLKYHRSHLYCLAWL